MVVILTPIVLMVVGIPGGKLTFWTQSHGGLDQMIFRIEKLGDFCVPAVHFQGCNTLYIGE